MRCQLVIIALFLTACATPPPQITGRYAASLSDADLQQIRLLVSSRRDFGPTLKEIEAVGRDRVRVDVGHYRSSRSWLGTSFFIVRQDAVWRIDADSPVAATAERTITVY